MTANVALAIEHSTTRAFVADSLTTDGFEVVVADLVIVDIAGALLLASPGHIDSLYKPFSYPELLKKAIRLCTL